MTLLVSVVVPTYHRPALMRRCLEALCEQTMQPSSYEIIVADDAPEDEVRHLAESFPARCHVRYLPVTATQGPAGARNAGWRAARGKVIAFTDDDTIPQADWLLTGMRAITEGTAAVAGRVVMPLPERPTDYEKDAAGLATAEFVTANCFVRRDALESVGGFDERFTAAWREDSDLQFRLLDAGYSIARADDAIVVHPIRPAPFGVSLRQQRKVVFDALLYRKHPRFYRERIRRVPPVEYYLAAVSVVVGAAAAVFGGWRAALGAWLPWLLVTAYLTVKRLYGTARTPGHIAEMTLTSAAIPLASVFWRAVASVRYRVLFL